MRPGTYRSLAVAAATLTAFALAGCSDGGDDDLLTAEQCQQQGLVLGEREVMDNETGEHRTEAACVEPGPPATVEITGLPQSVQSYTPVTFEWVLHTADNESHAMRTEVRFDTQVNVGTDCGPQEDLRMPDDWGDSVALKEHQNFMDGQSYEASFTPEEPGEYCFRAYALVSQTNVWSEPYTLNVTEVQPTGATHPVSVSGGGLPMVGGLDPADLTITLGDAVAWQNGDPFPVASYNIDSTSGPESFSTTAGGEAVVFLVPGNYAYEATGEAGSYSGSITVQLPAA